MTSGRNPESVLMFDVRGAGADPAKINFAKLPRVPSKHAVISDVRDRGGKWVNHHAYLHRSAQGPLLWRR